MTAQSSSINKDAKSGDSIKLDCRFDPNRMKVSPNTLVPMWQRIISDTQFEVIATSTHSFERSYKLEYSLNEGKYDLLIHSASYDRDNGNFVCIIKESGSGNIIKTISYILTILSKYTHIHNLNVFIGLVFFLLSSQPSNIFRLPPSYLFGPRVVPVLVVSKFR